MKINGGIDMRMYDLIIKKRNGDSLTEEEINFVISGYTDGSIPDYQMSALLMAIYFNGMNAKETLSLTMAMRDSGDVLDLSGIVGTKVDKHSTGGVGDKTSLVLTPMVAACGGTVAKMSGRGLGHTGGTIDKLESFPGFHTGITEQTFMDNVNSIGISIMGQTADLAPADKKLYALRDVTGTVDSIPLIASSIMSKKLAAGADSIVLDVKTGSGAFMKTEDMAEKLATEMVTIGNGAGKNTSAIISDMDQPLGLAVGNALEVIEAINTLNGNGPKDLHDLCMELGSHMLVNSNVADSLEDARGKLEESIRNKSALNKFAEFIKAQGGDESYCFEPEKFELGKTKVDVVAKEAGYVKHIECTEVGICSLMLGGGRETKESIIDLGVGIILAKKVGDYVEPGEAVATIYANDESNLEAAKIRLLEAYDFSVEKQDKNVLIKKVIR